VDGDEDERQKARETLEEKHPASKVTILGKVALSFINDDDP
jgi:hypothetical protein